jgi:hypothetical protein
MHVKAKWCCSQAAQLSGKSPLPVKADGVELEAHLLAAVLGPLVMKGSSWHKA